MDEQDLPGRPPPGRDWIEFGTRREVPPVVLFHFPVFVVLWLVLIVIIVRA